MSGCCFNAAVSCEQPDAQPPPIKKLGKTTRTDPSDSCEREQRTTHSNLIDSSLKKVE